MLHLNTQALWQELRFNPSHPLLFNDGFFIYFFTLFILLYYCFRANLRIRNYIFILFSAYFLYKASGAFLSLAILSALVNFLLANALYHLHQRRLRKGLLLLSISFNLGLLAYFKYTNFFIALSNDWWHTAFHPVSLLLPVGISFYTFENLSYTIDVYRRAFRPTQKFSDYLLFLLFFPKLVMGPIVRAADFIPQLYQPYHVSETQFGKGFLLIVSGLFKKLIISDYITANFTDYVFSDPSLHTGLECLLAVYAYAVVIYCDFSGYSDVAIGLAAWLGFDLPDNFRSPYQSANITEFWRRWHISLSSWLRDYLYIPMGGNRKSSLATYVIGILVLAIPMNALLIYAGLHQLLLRLAITTITMGLTFVIIQKRLAGKQVSSGLNQFGTMLLGGLWHGASLNFIVWGAWHGLGLAAHKVWKSRSEPRLTRKPGWLGKLFGVLLTFHFVCLGWIFFKCATLQDAVLLIGRIFGDLTWQGSVLLISHYHKVLLMVLLGFLLHALPEKVMLDARLRMETLPALAYALILLAMVIIYSAVRSSEQILPIYFQF